MKPQVDVALDKILTTYGVRAGAFLGKGGEATVYALDEARVLRILHPGASVADATGRQALLAELNQHAGDLPFAIPEVLATESCAGRVISIERRLPGRPLNVVLEARDGAAREALIRAYLAAAAQIGAIRINRPWYGDLIREDSLRTATFRAYLAARAAASLAAAGPAFTGVDPNALAAALPEPDRPNLVHLDAFAGNMLSEAGRITAILDFGAITLMGDRRLDPVAAAVYLDPATTPSARDEDRAAAASWLAEQGLLPLFQPVRRWLAAFWSFAQDDVPLHNWCRAVLLDRDGEA